jgi:hypothetical protein
MGKNNRPRRTSQRPSAAHLSPGSGSPQDGERIPLDEGCQQLLSVCSPRSLRGAAWQVHTAWIKGDLPVWRDGKLADPDEYSFRVWTDVDGCERLKVRKGTDAVTTSGDRLLGIDQSNHKWETSAAGIAALTTNRLISLCVRGTDSSFTHFSV